MEKTITSKKKKSIVSKKSVSGKKKRKKKFKIPVKEIKEVESKMEGPTEVVPADEVPTQEVTKESPTASILPAHYTRLSPANFAGGENHAPHYTYPIETLEKARRALAEAHFAPHPEAIQREVYCRWPELKPRRRGRCNVEETCIQEEN